MDIVVSCITKNYSHPRSVVKYNPKWKYYMFVDDENLELPEPWEKVYVEELHDRAPKMLTHKFLGGWDRMIWIDGSCTLTEDPDLIVQLLGEDDFVVRRHTRARNIFEDLNKCILNNKADPHKIIEVFGQLTEQSDKINMREYAELGFFARHNRPHINMMCEDWAAKFNELGIGRDQPAFALTVRGKIKMIDPYKIKIMQVGWHTKERLDVTPTVPKVHYTTLLGGELKVQKYLEETLGDVPDDHWICITDADSLFLSPTDGALIEEAIRQNPDTHLFGCMTNRQGLHWQVAEDNMFDNPDMTYHSRTAQLCAAKFGTYAPLINIPIAGQFMLMPAWVWKHFKFQEELSQKHEGRTVFFDWDFCERLLLAGGKIRLLKGLYRFHLYRLVKGHQDITHLTG